ncbi:hypothetical protein [Halarcobacter sp.]|uniref:hypothetical protein n=1 Tax=Halarcobacter sp. TaxID=2321133 RepID=UPI0029F473DC|nr:hypothetical protein [Halarcobacter sp.]
METLYIIGFILLLIISILISISSIKYFLTMWKFKNRKKDKSEDDDFKYFD